MTKKPKTPKLTQLQEGFVKARSRGMTRKVSAILAGSPSIKPDQAGKQLDESVGVKAAMLKEVTALRANTGVSKKQIIAYLVDATEMARMLGDPMGMIAGSRELGKMLGHYAPEVKKLEMAHKHEHELGQRTLDALEQLDDKTLLRIAHGRTIDADYRRIDDTGARIQDGEGAESPSTSGDEEASQKEVPDECGVWEEGSGGETSQEGLTPA